MTTATIERSTMTTLIEKVTTVEGVLEWCNIGKKAYSVIEKLKFHLMTKEDIANFIVEFENRLMGEGKKGGLDYMKLAKEIGSYHYTYTDYNELENMDIKDALERLFNEPISNAKLSQFEASTATMRQLYELKRSKPMQHFSTSLIYF